MELRFSVLDNSKHNISFIVDLSRQKVSVLEGDYGFTDQGNVGFSDLEESESQGGIGMGNKEEISLGNFAEIEAQVDLGGDGH